MNTAIPDDVTAARAALQRLLVRAFVAVARLREEQAREALAAERRPL